MLTVFQHHKEVIQNDRLSYSIDGMYKGRMVNLGTNTVIIDDTPIPPLGEFSFDYSPGLSQGIIRVEFPVAKTKSNNRNESNELENYVICYYGKLATSRTACDI